MSCRLFAARPCQHHFCPFLVQFPCRKRGYFSIHSEWLGCFCDARKSSIKFNECWRSFELECGPKFSRVCNQVNPRWDFFKYYLIWKSGEKFKIYFDIVHCYLYFNILFKKYKNTLNSDTHTKLALKLK